jgi:hypothetical protein
VAVVEVPPAVLGDWLGVVKQGGILARGGLHGVGFAIFTALDLAPIDRDELLPELWGVLIAFRMPGRPAFLTDEAPIPAALVTASHTWPPLPAAVSSPVPA